MNITDLEEALSDLLPDGFSIETDKNGQLVVYTNLEQDDDGELDTYSVLDVEEEYYDSEDMLEDDEPDFESF